MPFADIHCHILSATDDGPETDDEMYALLDAMYADGERCVCVTPHYHTVVWADTAARSDEAFDKLKAYAARYPDLTLLRGNELLYQSQAPEEIAAGRLRTLGGSRYVLVEFSPQVEWYHLSLHLKNLLAHGFVPVCAHAERYACLWKKRERYAELVAAGVVLQVNASSLFGVWGASCARVARRLLRTRLAAVVASDAHHPLHRPPGLARAYRTVCRRWGAEYAERLFWHNPLAIVHNESLY